MIIRGFYGYVRHYRKGHLQLGLSSLSSDSLCRIGGTSLKSIRLSSVLPLLKQIDSYKSGLRTIVSMSGNKVELVGKLVNVVNHKGISIDECIGNVATKQDRLSLAVVRVSSPTSEPVLTLAYDEWMYVVKGTVELRFEDEHGEERIVVAKKGDVAMIHKGTTFQPVFPEADTEYLPICLPAFSPERCVRHEEESAVSRRLADLHASNIPGNANNVPGNGGNGVNANNVPGNGENGGKSVNANNVPGNGGNGGNVPGNGGNGETRTVFHMCQAKLWAAAKESGGAYFPPTFEQDGMFTHATAVPQRLIATANHFYTSSQGDWLCLQLDAHALRKLGIATVFEEAKPVGATPTDQQWDWLCPHIYGGIPTSIPGVVTNTYPIRRDAQGTFLSIDGLTD